MTFKNKLLILIIAVTSISAHAQKTLLWEISGRGLTKPSYLYGTMHMVCGENTKPSEGLKNAIKNSSKVFFEIDMDDLTEVMGVLQYARMNNGLKITDLVTPVEYERLEAYFKETKSPLPLSMMARFKPYFISAIIAQGLMNCEKRSSVEQIIMAEAKKDDKEITGLETVEFQASLFDSIPYEKQAQDLVMYVDSIDNYKNTINNMAEVYAKQDVEKMDSLILQSDPGIAQFMDLLLYNRNYRWADQITGEIFDSPALFAVGAGHLGGDKGVINLLKQKGFTLKPLKN